MLVEAKLCSLGVSGVDLLIDGLPGCSATRDVVFPIDFNSVDYLVCDRTYGGISQACDGERGGASTRTGGRSRRCLGGHDRSTRWQASKDGDSTDGG